MFESVCENGSIGIVTQCMLLWSKIFKLWKFWVIWHRAQGLWWLAIVIHLEYYYHQFE